MVQSRAVAKGRTPGRRAAGSQAGSSGTPGRNAGTPDRARKTARRAAGANGKRELNKAHNRAEILVAARDVFTELGYDAATVRDIIRRTKLASGTFYNYFPDKESVFRELLRDAEERRQEWLARANVRTSTYAVSIEDGFRAYFEFVAADRTMFDLLRRNASTIRAFAGDPVLVNGLKRLRQSLVAQMDAGRFPRVDADYLANAMFGIAFEVAVIMVERDPVDVVGATEFATNLFLGCLERTERNASRAKGKAAS